MGRLARLGFVNALTLIRLPLVLGFFAGAIVNTRCPHVLIFSVSMVALVASAITDLLDGYFARRLGVVTAFGAHADPLMDKLFLLCTLPLLVFVAAGNGHERHAIVLLVVTVLCLARDQWVTFLRSIGSLYSESGAAHWTGKLRTAVNFPLVCVVYYFEAGPVPLPLVGWPVVLAAEGVAIVVTLASVYAYTRRYWPSLARAMGRDD